MRERTENKETNKIAPIKYENEKPNCPELCRAQKNFFFF